MQVHNRELSGGRRPTLSDIKSFSDGFSLETLKNAIRKAHPKTAFGFFDICQTETSL
jgi:hypothetical protein